MHSLRSLETKKRAFSPVLIENPMQWRKFDCRSTCRRNGVAKNELREKRKAKTVIFFLFGFIRFSNCKIRFILAVSTFVRAGTDRVPVAYAAQHTNMKGFLSLFTTLFLFRISYSVKSHEGKEGGHKAKQHHHFSQATHIHTRFRVAEL